MQVHKLMIIVQLLLGEIPERSLFRQPVLRKPLQPYLRLTQSAARDRARGRFRQRADSSRCRLSSGAGPWRAPAGVRVGNVRQFQEVMVAHSAQFIADKTFTLIMRYVAWHACRAVSSTLRRRNGCFASARRFVSRRARLRNTTTRLRHNVIKTGVRMISLSYSRISLADLAFKLHLDSVEDAEYIVAKVR